MADYLYETRIYVDISWVGRGRMGAGVGQNNSNIAGQGPNQGPMNAPSGQTLRLQQREPTLNAIGTPPTAAQIGAAMTTAVTNIQGQITPAMLAQIQNWALGQE